MIPHHLVDGHNEHFSGGGPFKMSEIHRYGLKHLISIQTLEKLYISETGVTAGGIALVSSLANLSVLD